MISKSISIHMSITISTSTLYPLLSPDALLCSIIEYCSHKKRRQAGQKRIPGLSQNSVYTSENEDRPSQSPFVISNVARPLRCEPALDDPGVAFGGYFPSPEAARPVIQEHSPGSDSSAESVHCACDAAIWDALSSAARTGGVADLPRCPEGSHAPRG